MIIARLVNINYKAKVYRLKEGGWYIKYSWTNPEGPYLTQRQAYRQAFLKTSLIRRWF